MPSDRERLQKLLEKYLHNSCSRQELREFWQLMAQFSGDDSLDESLAALWQAPEEQDIRSSQDDKERILGRIIQNKPGSAVQYGTSPRRMRSIFKLAAAAVFAGFVVLGYQLFLRQQGAAPQTAVAPQEPAGHIVPGGNKAILTLSDGTTIRLDSARKGTLAQQGTVNVTKISNGSLAYDPGSSGRAGRQAGYNTLVTPRGGQYELTLSDGTKVWLNAASSIRFPAVFAGAERQVEITGEAYFEVAQNAAKPFKVSVGGMTVEVLGTSFNVMAYRDEAAIRTTLVEGSVKVVGEKKAIRLVPGQQTQLSDGNMTLVRQANVNEAVAWKDGFFEFDDSGVADIMRQIARWYDVTVVYPDGIPAGHITGKIPRNTDLSNILKMMQLSGVHFTVKGREVVVL